MLLFDLGRTGVHMGAKILGGEHASRLGIKCRFDGAFNTPWASAHFSSPVKRQAAAYRARPRPDSLCVGISKLCEKEADTAYGLL
jgi:hypothetical protein